MFQGATARLIVHLADESDVIANVAAGNDLPFLMPGNSVYLAWEPGDAYLLSGWPMRPGATANDIDTLEALADS